ncbi:MAG TPA: universal stress protein [Burkholderiaceae bacterium]|nr:universal stress protein [Burkholderiaceae bacterium]
MYKRILLAYDGSESGQKALLDGLDIAQWSHAEMFLIAVMPPTTPIIAAEGGIYDSELEDQMKKKYQAILDDGLRRLSNSSFPATGEVLVGDSVEVIIGQAKKRNTDLIVVGHKHLDSWAARWWRGSRSPALIEHSHCSVLVVITN